MSSPCMDCAGCLATDGRKCDRTFDGSTFNPAADRARLGGQLERVRVVMLDGKWRTLEELAGEAHGSEAGVSARLRDLRKEKFGGHTVERRRRGEEESRGLHEYRLVVGKP